ncbi:MAG: hypothetical protein NZ874_05670 [Fimbriimonadales bacterium]|nr:hypothetical protein [Fimbriimonadales bacterium]
MWRRCLANGTNTVAPVGATTFLSSPTARMPSYRSVGVLADTTVARTVLSVPALGHDCPSHGCLGGTPKPRVACVGGTPTLRGTTS